MHLEQVLKLLLLCYHNTMKGKRLWLLTCVILIVIGCVAHMQWQRTHDLSSQIHQLIHSQNENLDIGVAFQSVRTHQPLYQFNHRRTFVPASNLKLVTAIAALDFLGPDFQYKTDIQFDTTKITEDALNGDVVLRFSGDPTFSSKSLDTLLI